MTLENKSRRNMAAWLHGWPRMSKVDVLMGTSLHCVGCGKGQAVICVAFDGSWEHWIKDRPDPDWPFDEESCPVCYLSNLYSQCHNQHYRPDSGEEIAGPDYIQIGKDGMPIRDLRNRLPK